MRNVRLFCIAAVLLTCLGLTNAAPKSKAKDIMTGSCGENITWRLTDHNELFIKGSGPIESARQWIMNSNELTKITLEGELTHIDEVLLYDLPACTEFVLIGNTGAKSVKGAVFTADGTRLLAFPQGRQGEYIVPEGVTVIGEQAFQKSSLSSIQLPSTLRTISQWSFVNSVLTRVEANEGLDSIGVGAFQYCQQLQSIYLSSSVRITETMLGGFCPAFERFEISEENPYFSVENGVLYDKDMTWLLIYPEGKKDASFTTAGPLKAIAPGAFVGAAHLEQLTLTNQVWWISSRAFSQCAKLASVTLPEGLYYIGPDAFEYCPQLKSLSIPSSVRKLGNDICSEGALEHLTWNPVECELEGSVAFRCTHLKELTLGERVKRIPSHLLVDATDLKQLRIPASVTHIDKEAFLGCDNVEEIYWDAIACEDLELGASLLPHRSSDIDSKVRKLIIGERVQRLPAYIFSDLTELRSVVIPNAVKEIGMCAFWNDYNLNNLVLGSSVETIGDYAFGYTAIGRMVFPMSVKRCGKHLFSNCKRLSEIVWLPPTYDGFTTDNNLFYFHDTEKDQVTYNIGSQITSVQFGDDIIAVPNAFCAWLSGLTSIYLPASIQQIGAYAFGECSSLKNVAIPSKVKFIAEGTFYACSSLQSVVFPATLTDIGDHAFRNCTSLVELNLPANLRKVGDGAFYGCMHTKNILLPFSVQSVGREAFMFTNSEQPVVIPASLTEIGHIAFACISTPAFEVNEKNPAYSDKNGLLFNKDKTVVLACPRTMTGKIKLPGSVLEVAEGAFANSQIETVDLPGKLTTIGPNAFFTSAITSITIPKGVSRIPATAFQKCDKLTSVKMKNKDIVIEDGAFDNKAIISY